jgi:hypothetical protein
MQWLPLCKYLHPQVYFGKRCATVFVKAKDAPAADAEPMDLPYGTAMVSQAAYASSLATAAFAHTGWSWQGADKFSWQTRGHFQMRLLAGIAGCLVVGAAASNTAGPAQALRFRLLQSQLRSCVSGSLAEMINGCLSFPLRYAFAS